MAWQRGREAAAAAERDQAAVREAAAGAGATATPAGWVAPPGGPAIPALTLRAYREAAAWAAGFDPGCRLPWTVLAGIGRIESNHGLFGGAATRFSAAGTVSPRITGPPLDGNGVASIPDSDGGRWDGDATWDRAVGPMQFIPTTWRSLGRDGNGDRVADPNNLFDAAVSAAGYLCLGGDGSLADPARLRQAIYAYNHSWDYVDAVLGWARVYQGGVATGPAVPGGPPAPSTTATPPTGPPAQRPARLDHHDPPPDHHHRPPDHDHAAADHHHQAANHHPPTDHRAADHRVADDHHRAVPADHHQHHLGRVEHHHLDHHHDHGPGRLEHHHHDPAALRLGRPRAGRAPGRSRGRS